VNIRDCRRAIKIDSSFRKLYEENYNNAWQSYRCLIEIMRLTRPGMTILLHHVILGCENYEEWNPVIPMFADDHRLFHASLHKGTGKYGVCYDDPLYHIVRVKTLRDLETSEQREIRLAADVEKTMKRRARIYATETPEERLIRLSRENKAAHRYREENLTACRKRSTEWKRKKRLSETTEEREKRLAHQRQRYAKNREYLCEQKKQRLLNESPEHREKRLAKMRVRNKANYAQSRKLG